MGEYPLLRAVMPLDDYRLLLSYGDGESREYDFRPHLTHKFFEALKDPKLFSAVSVNEGRLEWETGQDFCPDTLYEGSVPRAWFSI